MPKKGPAMTPEQRWLFDVDGVITVPGALTQQQVAEVNAVMDARAADPTLEEAGGSTGLMMAWCGLPAGAATVAAGRWSQSSGPPT